MIMTPRVFENLRTIDLRFQKSPLSKAFSIVSVWTIHIHTEVFENALVWMGPKTIVLHMRACVCSAKT